MTVQSILREKGRFVELITPTETSKEAADRMREKNISALVVANGDQILGIVSERDIVQGLARHGKALGDLLVSEIGQLHGHGHSGRQREARDETYDAIPRTAFAGYERRSARGNCEYG